ncbi:hypothetical protein SAMN05660772_02818 [Pasteurella testudinis DSM 23072]|uniref:Uncharacterized protein n=1 Tax=Pasteurella testudinis DSM 23072 TaxID=1122938 RepID=A0A1W1V5C8_9PAST|nr:LuxR family transcriptional regulator [Pasteurella testudinis]SMB88495.1 hypothetical protein SAMN05660772_02818 [Pasteurella testudinis DSM 23072]SUB51625.1 Uncharacterised protein [Pasteurella testudinis]
MTKKITKPKIEINLKQVEALAARGLTQQQIADSLGISETTLYTNKRENVDFAEAIKRGKAKGIATVTNKLFAKIEEGNLTATIFYLKTQAGWRETEVTEIRGEINQTVTEISKADYAKVREEMLKQNDC